MGVTDSGWFEFLAALRPDEVNFWRPKETRGFRTLRPYEPFLFKLRKPKNFIVGGGSFVSYSALPLSVAWDAFEVKNGGDYWPQRSTKDTKGEYIRDVAG